MKKEKILKMFITINLLSLPLIDIFRGLPIKDLEFYGLSIIELFNTITIIIPFFITFLAFTKKEKKRFIIYFLIFIIYIAFHLINIFKFNINIYPYMEKNYLKETYYILRTYFLPMALLITLTSNPNLFNRNYFLNLLRYYTVFICGLIVFCNVVGFSYNSYGDNIINNSHFWQVFSYQGNYENLLTCGLFTSANQISNILVILLPMNIYNYYKYRGKLNFSLIILQLTAMVTIGTKVSSLGSFLIMLTLLIIYLMFGLFKKIKINKTFLVNYLLMLLFSISLISVSPFILKFNNDLHFTLDKYTNEEVEKAKLELDYAKDSLDFEKIMYKNKDIYKIDEMFYKLYPISLDQEFWHGIAKRDYHLNNDFRIIKKDIINNIVIKNNNIYDKLFGVGYILNFMDIEVDYVYQYYLFGIVGLLLLVFQYIIVYIKRVEYFGFQKKKLKYGNVVLFLSPFMGLICCFFAGHLFGYLGPMCILAFSIAFMCNKDVLE